MGPEKTARHKSQGPLPTADLWMTAGAPSCCTQTRVWPDCLPNSHFAVAIPSVLCTTGIECTSTTRYGVSSLS